MIKTKVVWLALPFTMLIALSVLAFNEARLGASAWWACLMAVLLALAFWKHQVRIGLSQNRNFTTSEAELNSAKPMLYWLLGTYFFITGGFLTVMILSRYYGFKIPVSVVLAFFSLWWIKKEIWCVLLSRNGVRSV